VDIGFDKLYPLSQRLPKGKRITVRVFKRKGTVDIKLASKDDVPFYWGYDAHYQRSFLHNVISHFDADLILGTSKYGTPIYELFDSLSVAFRRSKRILLLFGSPHEGLFDICERDSLNLHELTDFIINTVPYQGCETVRTEEALIATLSILNILHSPTP